MKHLVFVLITLVLTNSSFARAGRSQVGNSAERFLKASVRAHGGATSSPFVQYDGLGNISGAQFVGRDGQTVNCSLTGSSMLVCVPVSNGEASGPYEFYGNGFDT